MTVPSLDEARICIVLLTGLGDVVNGLPLVNAIKDRHPGCHVTWVVEPMPAPILQPHPSVDEVVVYRKKDGVAGVRRLASEQRTRRFDVTVNLNVYFKSVWPTLLSGAPLRLGFDRGRAFDGTWLAANRRLPRRPRAHTAEMFLEFLELLGIPRPAEPEWRIPFTAEERRAQRARFADDDRPLAAIVPATANRKKDWLPERWARVAEVLDRELGFRVILVGGPGERESRLAREIADAAGVEVGWELGEGVRRVAWTLDACDLVLSPDTGPLHIARALGVPVVGLYGHTNPWRVGPYRAYHDLWVDAYTDAGAAPDPSSFTPKLGRMETITVDDVLSRARLAVQRYSAGRPPRRARTGAIA